MLLGYNTNSLAHHDPREAIKMLADIGYRSLAITVDHQWLSPKRESSAAQIQEIKYLLQEHSMRCVIETGARFLLNPRHKHQPTMLNDDPADRKIRADFLRYCIDVAVELESDCVSLWSGKKPAGLTDQQALERLAEELEKVADYAGRCGQVIGFEPEPGMFVDSTSSFERLLQWIDLPSLKMTMDIGHLYCQGEFPVADYIARWSDRIVNVHIEDMRLGVHDHLMFGEGEIDFVSVMDALRKIDTDFGVHVELSRHSHDAANIARRSYEYLMPMMSD